MNEDIKGHLAAIKQWLTSRQLPVSASTGLSKDERKQLLAINKSIQQLTVLGVSIPDELRQLKLRLSAKDFEPLETDATQNLTEDVELLIDELNVLVQTAKCLRNKLRSSGKTVAIKRSFNVTLYMLLKSGLISLDDTFELAWKKGTPVFRGTLGDEGVLLVQTKTGLKTFDSLSTAASTLAECSLNGWLHWKRINADGTRTALKDIRDEFISEGGNI